ncbi:MAG: transcriptional coactivator p15/PC4 family protein [Candidatus Thorarchaeota archaeon]|jgi:hypothetical protein
MSDTQTVENKQQEIGTLDKGKGSKVKVRLNTFKGKNYVDVRTFLGDEIPTTKGVSLPVAKLSDLINLLEKAEEEVTKNGMS